MDASNNPAKRVKKEITPDEFAMGQRAAVNLDREDVSDIIGEPIGAIDDPFNKDLLDELKFMEDAMTIRVEATNEKYAPKFVHCAVQGRGAEILHNNRWIASGWLPVGVPVTTRRKYVEVLLRSKVESYQTEHDSATVEDPKNWLTRSTSAKVPVSILSDDNPKGREWVQRIYAEF